MNGRKLSSHIFKIRNNNMLTASMYSLASKALAMLFFLATDIIIARMSGKLIYGEWSFYYTIIAMCYWIINFGVSSSARVHVARSRNDEDDLFNCLKASMALRFWVTNIIFICLIIILPNCSKLLGYPNKYPDLKWMLIVGSLHCAFYSWVEFFKNIFIGLDRIKGLFVITVVEYFLYMVFGAGGLVVFGSVKIICVGYLIAEIASFVVGIILFEKYTNLVARWVYKKANIELILAILRYSIPILFINIGALILIEMDSFMIGMYFSDGTNGIYSIAKSLIQKMTNINFAISSVIMTEFAIITKDDYNQKRRRYKKIRNLNIIISTAIALVAYILGYYAIKIMYGNQYLESSTVFRILLPYYIFYGMNLFSGTLLDYQKMAYKRLIAYSLMVFMNLVMNFILIPRYGANGAAVATVLSLVPYTIILEILANGVFSIKTILED